MASRGGDPEAATRALRILFLAPAMPYPPIWGSGVRNYHLLRHLSRHHEVTLVTYATSFDPAAERELGKICARAVYVPPPVARSKRRTQFATLFSRRSFHGNSLVTDELQTALDGELSGEPYDIVFVAQSCMAGLRVAAEPALTVLDEHNIEYEALLRSAVWERSPARKLYYFCEHVKHRREEISAWKRVAACTVTSGREADIVRGVVPGKPVAVVKNSVDTEYFRPSDLATDPDGVVFTGLMSYRPNVDAVHHFVRSVLPLILRERPRAHLTVVGAGPPDEVRRLAGPHVVVTGAVDDVRPYVGRASVVVVPIRFGGGTRFKVAEAMAMGKAVVATSLGAEGIGVRHRQEILLADDPHSFAAAVLELLGDPSRARAMGVTGRAFAERNLSWLSAGTDLEQFLVELSRGHVSEVRSDRGPIGLSSG